MGGGGGREKNNGEKKEYHQWRGKINRWKESSKEDVNKEGKRHQEK